MGDNDESQLVVIVSNLQWCRKWSKTSPVWGKEGWRCPRPFIFSCSCCFCSSCWMNCGCQQSCGYWPAGTVQLMFAVQRQRRHSAGSLWLTPNHQEVEVGSNEFMECQFDHRDPSRAQGVVPALAHRLAQALQMRGAYAYIVHGISRNFTMKNTNLFMDHLIRRCKGNLIPYVEDRQLLLDHSVNIIQELGFTMLAEMQVVKD